MAIQKTTNESALLTIEKKLEEARGRISPPEAVAATGLSINEVNSALERLIELYEARVTVNPENASLLFVFPWPLRKRGSKTFKEQLETAAVWFWRIFKIIYKAMIAVILIGYTLAFVAIIIGISMSGNRDRDSKSDFGGLLEGIFRALAEAFRFAAWNNMMFYAIDPYSGMRYKTTRKPKEEKNFVTAVFDFVFGPERPPKDPLEDAREAAAFIRRNNAKITSGHVVLLTGVDYSSAEARMAEYASRFKGDLQVSEEGVVVGEYHDLIRRENVDLKDAKIEYYWDEVEPPYVLNGNSTSRNLIIGGLNLFNLVAAIMVGSQFEGILFFVLCIFPVAFSVLFFAIPVARTFYVAQKEAERHRNIFRKKFIHVIATNPHGSFTQEQLIARANIPQEDLGDSIKTLEKLVQELEGDLALTPDGKAVYTFPRLARELAVR
ncbi:MAG TPA: hypothetical protein VEC36_09555 [Patescibacteria group bacterium]|nr:hypothetical protein [Patescibacteria group bacterium]